MKGHVMRDEASVHDQRHHHAAHDRPTLTQAMVSDAVIRLTFDDSARLARRHAIGGVLTDTDRAGLYRRVARASGTTSDRVALLCADR